MNQREAFRWRETKETTQHQEGTGQVAAAPNVASAGAKVCSIVHRKKLQLHTQLPYTPLSA